MKEGGNRLHKRNIQSCNYKVVAGHLLYGLELKEDDRSYERRQNDSYIENENLSFQCDKDKQFELPNLANINGR